MELVEQCESPPDILLVCCGGGGLCSGVATAVKLSGWTDTRIYGVEPENGKFFFIYIHIDGEIPYRNQIGFWSNSKSLPFKSSGLYVELTRRPFYILNWY